MKNSAGTVMIRVYVAGVLVGELEVDGPLSTKGAQSGGKKGGRKA